MWVGRILVFALYVNVTWGSPNEFTTVSTDNGNVKGYRIPVNDRDHLDVFLGIPYAEPPTGGLRFARPFPVKSWNGIHDATYYRPVCPQRLWYIQKYSFDNSFNMSEDCLYLNIFTPKLHGSTAKLPVMVWIHGGGFTYGSGAEYDGRFLALKGVVYVSINYRVGVMGFLSTGDSFAPGNQGQLDQLEALRWVKSNIDHFGGDPDKVTIFGQSSGGASVSTHIFSPLAKGLFRGVIAQSGVALSPFAFYRPPYKALDTARDLGKQNGCTQPTTQNLVKCLSTKPIEDLLNTRVDRPPMSAAYVQVVDGNYIHDLPETLLANAEVNDVALMTGTVPNETADEIEYISGIRNGISAHDVSDKVHVYSYRYGNKSEEVYRALRCQYDLSSSDPVINRDNLIAFQSDYGYHAPHTKLADGFSKIEAKTYYYSFEYRSPYQMEPKWEGVLHSTELFYVFGCPYWDSIPCPWAYCNTTWCYSRKVNDLDKKISDDMMTLWTNFAKHLDPNPDSRLGVTWPRYGSTKAYLQVRTSTTVQHRYREKEMDFWNQFMPKLLAGTTTETCPKASIIG